MYTRTKNEKQKTDRRPVGWGGWECVCIDNELCIRYIEQKRQENETEKQRKTKREKEKKKAIDSFMSKRIQNQKKKMHANNAISSTM